VAKLYTIGHSTRTPEEFIEILQAHSIRILADIRAFPSSRRLPHFNRDALEGTLRERGIDYMWMKALGGRRQKIRENSPHTAIRDESFRNYADYMLTTEFEQAAEELIRRADTHPLAYMCAEKMYSHCHRRMVSDWLVVRGHEVLHIEDLGTPKPHQLNPEARMVQGKLIYQGDRLF
jgi:uncharacterized protein (DUF488 family)